MIVQPLLSTISVHATRSMKVGSLSRQDRRCKSIKHSPHIHQCPLTLRFPLWSNPLATTSDLVGITTDPRLHHLRTRLLPPLLQPTHEPVLFVLVGLVVPLLLVVLDHAIHKFERDFGVDRLLRRLAALEHVVLREVQHDLPLRRRHDLTLLRDGVGKQFRHAVELRFDAVQPLGDADGIVEDRHGRIVRVRLRAGDAADTDSTPRR